MNFLRGISRFVLAKGGSALATCAFVFAAISANSSCVYPFYEPQEPAGLEKFKKHAC